MKAFIASLAVLLAVAATVTVSAVYADRSAGELLDLIESLPETPDGAVNSIGAVREKWDGAKGVLALFVSRTESDRTDAAISAVLAAAKAGDRGGYAVALSALRDSVLSLRRGAGSPFASG
ncbi:MAG: hypothetical protein IJM71_02745 [Clostridia bacterium]|nr:hypothetical protein [Clostridia bacterium]